MYMTLNLDLLKIMVFIQSLRINWISELEWYPSRDAAHSPRRQIFLDIPQLNAKPSHLWILERQHAESKFVCKWPPLWGSALKWVTQNCYKYNYMNEYFFTSTGIQTDLPMHFQQEKAQLHIAENPSWKQISEIHF